MRFAGRCIEEPGQQAFYGRTRGHLATVLSTDSIGQSEQPSAAARQLWGLRQYVANVILVMVASASVVRKLGELHLQHRAFQGTAPAGNSPGRASRERSSMTSVHYALCLVENGRTSVRPYLYRLLFFRDQSQVRFITLSRLWHAPVQTLFAL